MGNTRYEGFPKFQHGQWTFEGELERLGAFSSGARRVRGWRRWVAYLVVAPFLLTPVFGLYAFLRNFI